MKPINILMLSASLSLTGTHRILHDLVSGLDHQKFNISIAFKPEFSGPGNDLLASFSDQGFSVYALGGQKLFGMQGFLQLYQVIRRNKIDIIHCWDDLVIIARFLKLFTRCHVIESHGNPVMSKGSLSYYLLNKLSSILLDGVIFQSEGIMKSYENTKVIFLKRIKKSVIHNCINAKTINKTTYNRSEIKKRFGVDDRTIVLTNIGYFNEQKAQELLIQSIKIVVDRILQVKLIIVGWGPLENKLRELVKTLKIEDNVIFAGKRQHEEVFEILSITDLFVLSSLWEGFGLVIGEAMAMGKPVVATETDGSQVLVVENETGLLVPPGDPRALAAAIISLIRDPERRAKMGELGRIRVTTLFSPEKFIQAHESFYTKILNRGTDKNGTK